MNSLPEKLRSTRRIGLVALITIGLHTALALYVVFTPDGLRVSHKLLTIYRQLVVLGPFFTESRIKTSHYFSVRYQQNGVWSPLREFSKEHFAAYYNKPWRYDHILYTDYEKRLSYSIGKIARMQSFDQVKTTRSFRELNEFILQEYLKIPADSLHLTYGLNEYIPQTKSYRLDTLFSYTYNPSTIGPAKR